MRQEEQSPRPGPFKRLAMDLRSYALPHLRRFRGLATARFNDVANTLRLEKRLEEPVDRQWLRVLRRSRAVLDDLPEPTGPRVVIVIGYGFGGAKLLFESTLAMALRLRGAEPVFLLCDKALPACEFNRFGNFIPSPHEFGPKHTRASSLDMCRYCTQAIQDPCGLLPIRQMTFNSLLEPEDLARVTAVVDSIPYGSYGDYVYRGIHVGEHARASVMRATQRGTLLDNAETRWLFRRYLTATLLVAELAERVYSKLQPQRVVAHHGIYVTHGTVCEVARERGIPVIVHGIPSRLGTVVLSHGDTYHRTLVTEPASWWEDLTLTPAQKKQIDEYVASKRFGGRDYISYHEHAVDEPGTLIRELGLDPEVPIVSLYTNVLWDAQLYYEYTAFENMVEWLFETIRYVEGRKDLQLVIRVHPAEARGAMPTGQPLLPEIMGEFPMPPDNVKVIPPESSLSSYTLAEMSCAALIYGARMGIEIALCGTPLIVAGETFNRRKGYSYDAETREEYFGLLDSLPDGIPRNSPEMLVRARKYAFHLYFRRMIDFPFFSVKEGLHLTGPRLEFDHLGELKPGRNPALDTICDGILNLAPFVHDG